MRYGDAATRALRDDMVQEASLLVWMWSGQIHDEARIGAAVCTIARRYRARALLAEQRRSWLRYVEFGAEGVSEPVVEELDEHCLSIDGRTVPLGWARRRLRGVLAELTPLDQKLLMGFHEGFCCAELALRFGRSEDCVKTRIHRARRRVRIVFEDLVRLAGDLDDSETEE